MNQRPFISSNLNIYDETRCVFSSSFIGGQPVLISQEQNRKTCDTIMTSITSNQPRIGNCCCPSQQQAHLTNQYLACPLQAHRQGIPEGVMFNFPQANYSVPLSCMPSAYTPPPPPAPQIVECPYKTPQSVCTDFRKYGLEAMMFQDKLRKQCSNFSYDKKVGTSDQCLYPKNNLCCCGTQSTTLTADQKQDNFHRVAETDCQKKVKIFPWDTGAQNKEECICFPQLDPDEVRCADAERREESHRDCNFVYQAKQDSNSEENICRNYFDNQINGACIPKSTCLKKYDDCTKKNGVPKKCVSFSFCDKTLIMSENKNEQNNSSTKTDIAFNVNENFQSKSGFNKPSIYRNSYSPEKAFREELSEHKYKCDIIRQINHLKRKRKGIIRMYSFCNNNLIDSLSEIDKEIQDLRRICHGSSSENLHKCLPKCGGTSKLGEGYEEEQNFKHQHKYLNRIEKNSDDTNKELKQNADISFSTPFRKKQEARNIPSGTSRESQVATSKKTSEQNKIEDLSNSNGTRHRGNMSPKETTKNEWKYSESETKILLEKLSSLSANPKDENLQQNQTRQSNTDEIPHDKLQNMYGQKHVDFNQHVTSPDSENFIIPTDMKSAEYPSPEEKSISTSVSCIQGLKSCVPNCRELGVNEKKPEDSQLSDTEGEINQNIELNTKVIEGENIRENDVPSTASYEKKSNQNNDHKQSSGKKLDQRTGNIETEPVEENLSETTEDLKINISEQQVGEKNEVKETPNGENDSEISKKEVEFVQNRKSEIPEINVGEDQHLVQNTASCSKSCEKICNYEKENQTPDTNKHENKMYSGKFYPGSSKNDVEILEIEHDKSKIIETKGKVTEDRNFAKNNVSCSTSCEQNCDIKKGSEEQDQDIGKIENFEVQPIFQPCTCGRNLVSKCGNILYTLFAESIGTIRNVWQSDNSRLPQPRIPITPNDNCYRGRPNEYQRQFNINRRIISQDRFGTNKFCGRTCYDIDSNQWYSCCSHNEEHMVQITFRETAEKRDVLLTNGCRNSRFYVVYE